MSVAQLRPTFVLDTGHDTQRVMKRIRETVQLRSDDFQGQFTTRHAMISITQAKRHFWSPWLHLEMRSPDQQTVLFGRFSPHPSIWTGFMFAYLAIAVLVFFAVMLGVSQQLAGESAWAYYFIPIGILMVIALWFAAQAGQKLAQTEMHELKSMVDACVAESQPMQG